MLHEENHFCVTHAAELCGISYGQMSYWSQDYRAPRPFDSENGYKKLSYCQLRHGVLISLGNLLEIQDRLAKGDKVRGVFKSPTEELLRFVRYMKGAMSHVDFGQMVVFMVDGRKQTHLQWAEELLEAVDRDKTPYYNNDINDATKGGEINAQSDRQGDGENRQEEREGQGGSSGAGQEAEAEAPGAQVPPDPTT